MDLEFVRNYCMAKKGVTEHLPFDESTLVFKVGGKMFALTDLDNFQYINLKCDPEKAMELREQYNSVTPGYHMNKKHWNSVYPNQDMNDKEVCEWIDHSYQLVYDKLPKKLREEIG
ncbi:MmcQ/YjbR family DNA-binding protein [Sediminitomix flava]|uniref:Putative DNA-binding protein (MmcQ/YjbR family) n=1 Tax=Sediminitomix flava TaxID=379075 RepID=A0A315Z7Y0_SEDFL|nr:MmcQ/YjbR family DNA-binding protein [Sediminitomix flava]PWJ40768.1 putative DNA-binding protein (MmcQ/YjbR family) [Sediminitomix flava]